jgi:8-oxo-dGTP diphosphatase
VFWEESLLSEQRGIRVSVNAAIVRDGAIVLVEFDDEQSGLHYNLPGGGVEVGESLHEALRREVREETCAEVDVGHFLLVWEYVPGQYAGRYGPVQKLGLVFACTLREGSMPRLPEKPDADQTGVRWVQLDDLPQTPLLPYISERLIAALRRPADPDLLIQQI